MKDCQHIKNEKMYMLVPQMEYDRAIDEDKKRY